MTREPEAGRRMDEVETTILKGIAILLIASHNFLHVVPPSPGENEFNFDGARLVAVVQGLQAEPAAVVRLLAAYFGHYGVQLFILLSAYGLTRRFAGNVPPYLVFIRSRFARIYPTFLICLVLYLLRSGFSGGWWGPLTVLQAQWYPLLLKLTLVSNFVPGQALRPVGPWWFLPFIFQFYFLFPLLLAAHARWGAGALVAISAASVGAVLAVQGLPVEVMTTVVGHLPEFCLGIWLGSREAFRVPRWMIGVAVPLFALGNVFQSFWYVSHLSALVSMLAFWELAGGRIRGARHAAAALAFLGTISMPLFFVNGFLRQPFLSWTTSSTPESQVLMIAVVFLAVSIGVAVLVMHTERRIRRVGGEWVGRRIRVTTVSSSV